MRLEIETGYLDPIVLGKHEWVDVDIPGTDGYDPDIHLPEFRIQVFDDHVRVATGEDVKNRKDGQVIWRKPRKKDS